MTKMYRVELMSRANYNLYMSGSNNYHIEYYDVQAETKGKAIVAARHAYPGYCINLHSVKEITTECDDIITQIKELEEKLAQLKKKLEKVDKNG